MKDVFESINCAKTNNYTYKKRLEKEWTSFVNFCQTSLNKVIKLPYCNTNKYLLKKQEGNCKPTFLSHVLVPLLLL